jgi:hypothetical protein
MRYDRDRISSYFKFRSQHRCNSYHSCFTCVSLLIRTDRWLKMTAFWDIALCSLIEVDRSFRGVYCNEVPWWWMQYAPLKRQCTAARLHSAISQKAIIFTLAAIRNWKLTHRQSLTLMFIIKRRCRVVKSVIQFSGFIATSFCCVPKRSSGRCVPSWAGSEYHKVICN